MKLAELLQPWVKTILPDCEIFGIENDSRQLKPGMLFLAYPGVVTDGRSYIQQAKEAGAAAVVYDSHQLPTGFVSPNDIPCIPLDHLTKKLATLASRFYEHPSHALSVTGVTGTNGKTTIAYQLAQAYGLLGQRAAYMGTLGQGNVQSLKTLANTTPDALHVQGFLREYVDAGVSAVCMEVSSHALSQGRVDNVDFVQAIYTNLSHEHLDYHGTMEAYAAAKARLFVTPSLQWAIVNHDDDHAALMLKHCSSTCQQLTYGLQDGADVCAVNWQSTLSGSQLEVRSPWGQHAFEIQLLGAFNVYNSLAVFASLLASGQPIDDVLAIMKQLRASPGRMEVVAQNPCVIVDYAHTPDALENALSTLQKLKKGRLLVVFGCGGDRDKFKRPMMGRLASQYADVVVITSDNPRTEDPVSIVNEVAAGLLPNTNALTIVDRTDAIQQAIHLCSDDDILLIAGKGHETYQQIGQARFPFSDQAVVKDSLVRT